MTIKDLMIGDWVTFTNAWSQKYLILYGTIAAIYERYVIVESIGRLYQLPINAILPIQLNEGNDEAEKILVNIGFESNERGQFDYYDGEWNISYSTKYYGLWMTNEKNDRQDIRIDIHYLHELQHIFRLFGLTELADNFKVEGGAE